MLRRRLSNNNPNRVNQYAHLRHNLYFAGNTATYLDLAGPGNNTTETCQPSQTGDEETGKESTP